MNPIIKHFGDILKVAETAFTYQNMFDYLGISKKLNDMYISPKDLSKKTIDYLYDSVKKFVKQPMYKDRDLKSVGDLIFLRDSREFQDYMKDVFDKLQDMLSEEKKKNKETIRDNIMKYIKKYPSKSNISLEEIIRRYNRDIGEKKRKLTKDVLLLVLEDLKEDDKIYDYNGLEVTLN